MNKNITALILIILAAGIYFTVTKGMYADAQTVKAVNDQYSSALGSAEELIKVRDTVLKQYNNISENDRSRIDKVIPSTVDNIRLIIDLNNVALQHGFALKNIKATANKDKSPQSSQALRGAGSTALSGNIPTPLLDNVTVNFGMSATYQQFIDFLKILEQDLRLMDITKLTMKANDTGTYDYQVEMQTYWLRQQ